MNTINIFVMLDFKNSEILFLKDKYPKVKKKYKQAEYEKGDAVNNGCGDIMSFAYAAPAPKVDDKSEHIEHLIQKFGYRFNEEDVILVVKRDTPMFKTTYSCYWYVKVDEMLRNYMDLREDVVHMSFHSFFHKKIDIKDFTVIKSCILSACVYDYGEKEIQKFRRRYGI